MPAPTDYVKKGFLRAIDPAVGFLARHNVNPNTITTAGTLLTVGAGVVYATGHIMSAGWLMSLTAIFDVVDGQVARRTGKSTVFGAFYDSTLDRVADAALALGAAALGANRGDSVLFWSALIGLVASFLVSYVRAKAESMGTKAAVGLMPREARLLILLIGVGLWGVLGLYQLFVVAFAAVALLSVITLLQRIVFVARELNSNTEGDR